MTESPPQYTEIGYTKPLQASKMALRDNQSYNLVMDAIYSSFMRQKARVEGMHDEDIRDPHIIISIAKKLNLLPNPNNCIRISGSKGKGTCARMAAKLLEKTTHKKIALFISPEELDHNDRMSINGTHPNKQEFINLYNDIKPDLLAAENTLKDGQYLSPFGIFLLLSLKYFKNNQADYWVIECGRGAKYDEAGNIPSKISVITSILFEHAASLGPQLVDIAENKLSIALHSQQLVCTPEVANWNKRLNMVANHKIIEIEPLPTNQILPNWVMQDAALARAAVKNLLESEISSEINLLNCSAAFGVLKFQQYSIYFDASIHQKSIDEGFFKHITSQQKSIVLASLPDDKDSQAMRQFFKTQLNLPFYQLALSGTRGYLHYNNAKQNGDIYTEINYEDTQSFKQILSELMTDNKADCVFLIGTQTYIRLVKQALA